MARRLSELAPAATLSFVARATLRAGPHTRRQHARWARREGLPWAGDGGSNAAGPKNLWTGVPPSSPPCSNNPPRRKEGVMRGPRPGCQIDGCEKLAESKGPDEWNRWCSIHRDRHRPDARSNATTGRLAPPGRLSSPRQAHGARPRPQLPSCALPSHTERAHRISATSADRSIQSGHFGCGCPAAPERRFWRSPALGDDGHSVPVLSFKGGPDVRGFESVANSRPLTAFWRDVL